VIANRSIPPGSVIPELAYAEVGAAADWLCQAFGFRVRLRIGQHRVQLVRVDDADRHHQQARSARAQILNPPTDYPYGERQYSADDIGGHRWTFSQAIADVDPASWGTTSIDID
jgi:uncharacterized glyoxalase superfamily protein PhnB